MSDFDTTIAELRYLAEFIRTPGNILRDHAIDQCASLLDNRADFLASRPARCVRCELGCCQDPEHQIGSVSVTGSEASGIAGQERVAQK